MLGAVPTASLNLNAAQVGLGNWKKRKLNDLVKSPTWVKPYGLAKVSNIFIYFVDIF